MVKREKDMDIMVAESNTLLWILGAVFSVGVLVSVVYEDRKPEPGCVSYEQALSAGVMSYPDPASSGHSCG
jgi:hypothetical protein